MSSALGIVYKLTCLPNGKVYVGQTTKTLASRWSSHLAHVNGGRRCALQNAIRKYGADAFRVEELERCEPSLLNERESTWIAALGSHDPAKGYNRTMGGNEPLTADVRERLSEMRRGAGNPMFGKAHSPDVRMRMSATRRGRPAHNRGKSFPRVDNRMLTVDGATLTMSEWARRTGMSVGTIFGRLKRGWSETEAVLGRSAREAWDKKATMILTMLAEGALQREVAKALGITRSSVSGIKIRALRRGLRPVEIAEDAS